MESNQVAAFKLIEQAQQAMKNGEYGTARQFAAQAAQSAPELEEVWLIMAALASPRGSVAYVQRALDINPQSERAQKGMQWAQKRLQQDLEKQAAAKQASAEAPTIIPVVEEQPVVAPSEPPVAAPVDVEKPIEAVPEPVDDTPEEEKTAPRVVAAVSEPNTSPREPVETPEQPVVATTIQSGDAVTNRRYSNMTIPMVAVGVIVLISIIFLVLVSFTPAAALIAGSIFNGREHGPAWAQVNLARPTAGQSASESAVAATATPLAAPVPELPVPPTAADIPLSTEIQAPTSGPVPTQIPPTLTETPAPTATPFPTASPTATVEMAFAEGPSPTPLPTDTAVPGPTPYAASTARASGGNNTTAGAAGERWIDVDLTHQMVYAYEGNTTVNSFLVSTGTWQHPTVTGQYHVYVKYVSTTMTGPGYSLPNVPYTMYFFKGYGLHGTYWHSNFGTPMSHGCVNLSIPDSQWLYNWASVGTLVNVHY